MTPGRFVLHGNIPRQFIKCKPSLGTKWPLRLAANVYGLGCVASPPAATMVFINEYPRPVVYP